MSSFLSRVHGSGGWVVAFALAAVLAGCAALLAPQGSVITLTAGNTTIAANASTSMVASVVDNTGKPVEDGTRVSFQATAGLLEPPQVRTLRGTATTQFTASQPGTATITATSGSATSNPVVITVGSPITVSLTVSPTTPTVNTTVTFTATVSASNTTVQSYNWNFGDQATTTTTANSAQHVYTLPGTMTVTVTAVTAGNTGPTGQIQIVVQ